jgi:hypothetical protein
MRGFLTLLLSVIVLLGCNNPQSKEQKKLEADSTKTADLLVDNLITKDSVLVLSYKDKIDKLIYPIINIKYNALAKRVTPETILGQSQDEIRKNYAKCGCGFIALDYKKTFNNDKIVCFAFTSTFLGPYPTENLEFKTLTISDGNDYSLTDQYTLEGQNYILSEYKSNLMDRLEEGKKDNNKELAYADAYEQLKKNINEISIESINQNYIIQDDTMSLKTELVLPHAILAFEIDRIVKLKLTDLKKFNKQNASI